eukprot:TRINITY_DN5920_c0_g1_i2.p1 TRINITY_DN5920_c0_g1~~TRINITY_DN5920_c0_g1_i2.p1  ORF type:complete len:643 (-),score=166.25 TRINITY_DN5920_c0_g1_i2:110-2038(-)
MEVLESINSDPELSDHQNQIPYYSLRAKYLKHIRIATSIADTSEAALHLFSIIQSDFDEKAVLEQIFREHLRSVLAQSPLLQGADESHPIFHIIAVSIQLVKLDKAESTLPLSLLEDTFECLTIETCELVFDFVNKFETQISSWLNDRPGVAVDEANKARKSKSTLAFLRTFNSVLVRLSRTNETLFYGKILLFMAKMLPLSEKSGVNLMMSFNTANSTKLDTSEHEIENQAVYQPFWEVQKYFSNPPQSWQKFDSMVEHVNSVYDFLERNPLRAENVGGESQQVITESFVKYLTSKRLFHLQVNDNSLRRHILLQSLIYFGYLLDQISKAEKDPTKDQTKIPKKEQISRLRTRALSLLDSTPPNGRRFRQNIERILEHERIWLTWKDGKCEGYELAPANLDAITTEAHNATKRMEKPPKRSLAELSSTWKSKDYAAIFAHKPTADKSLDEVVDILYEQSQETDIDEEERFKNDEIFRWRAMRALVRQRYDIVPNFSSTYKRDLEQVAKHIRGDLPAPENTHAKDTAMIEGATESKDQSMEILNDSKVIHPNESDVHVDPSATTLEDGEESEEEGVDYDIIPGHLHPTNEDDQISTLEMPKSFGSDSISSFHELPAKESQHQDESDPAHSLASQTPADEPQS